MGHILLSRDLFPSLHIFVMWHIKITCEGNSGNSFYLNLTLVSVMQFKAFLIQCVHMGIIVGICVYFDFSFCQLIDLQVSVAPRIILKPLVPTFPCFASIIVSLMEKVGSG